MHEELLSLLPKPDLTRREFVVTTLAAGFALAVQPVSAQTITTDTEGIETGEVKVPEGERNDHLTSIAGSKPNSARSSW